MIQTVLSLIAAASLAGYGARLLFQTRGQLAEAQASHEIAIQERLARGSDSYAEELRSLQSYKPITSVWQRRLLGVLLLAVSLSYIVLTLFVPE